MIKQVRRWLWSDLLTWIPPHTSIWTPYRLFRLCMVRTVTIQRPGPVFCGNILSQSSSTSETWRPMMRSCRIQMFSIYIWAKICWLSRTNPTFCRWVLTSFFAHSSLCIVSIIQNVALVLDNLQIFAHFSDWSLSGDPQFIGNVHLFPGRRFERHHLNLEFSDRIGSRVSGKFDAAFSNETVDANWSVKRGGNLLRINSRPSRHDPLPFLQNLKRRKRDRECNLIAVIKINSKPTSNAADLERLLTNLGRKCANFESFLVKCGGFLV